MIKSLLFLLAMGALGQDARAIESPGAKPAQGKTTCLLETIDIGSGQRSIVLRTTDHIEAPNWSRDGTYFIFNKGGSLYRLPVKGGEAVRIDTGFANKCNNDHGISPDGTLLAISDSTRPGGVQIYTLPITGGVPRAITHPGAGSSYWHGWSPDGHTLAFVGGRNGNNSIYAIPAAGGKPIQLTKPPGKDDGSDYSPDGRYIYYNSDRAGHMQIWRIEADGANPKQITFDAHSDWFPHPSPDGKWIAFLSFVENQGSSHPANKDVMLCLMPVQGGQPRVLARFNGGQGTINVPSWSPDSRHFAFVSYLIEAPPKTP